MIKDLISVKRLVPVGTWHQLWVLVALLTLTRLTWTHRTSMKLLHPTIKLLQCAGSKEETELNSYLCLQSAVFHMSARSSNSWRSSTWKCEVSNYAFYRSFWHQFNLNDKVTLKSLACMSAHSYISMYLSSHRLLWPWERGEGSDLGAPP